MWSYHHWVADWLAMSGGMLVLAGGFVVLVFCLVRSSPGSFPRELIPAPVPNVPSGSAELLLAEFFARGEADAEELD